MAKPEIIGSLRSTYTRVVCMVCEEKGIEYVLTERPLHAPEIVAIHPFGKMPVLRHDDFELFESKAIATYLDRSFPGPCIFPFDPRLAALTEQWVSLVNTVIDPTLIRTYLFAYIAPKTADGGGRPSSDRRPHAGVARADWGSRQGGRKEWLSRRRSVHLRRHQPDADPLSLPAIPGRRGDSRHREASRRLLRPARGAEELRAHHSTPGPTAPIKAELAQIS